MLTLLTPSPPPPMDFHPSRREPAEPSSRLMASGSNTHSTLERDDVNVTVTYSMHIAKTEVRRKSQSVKQTNLTGSQMPLSVHMEATLSPPWDFSTLFCAELALGAASGSVTSKDAIVSVSKAGEAVARKLRLDLWN